LAKKTKKKASWVETSQQPEAKFSRPGSTESAVAYESSEFHSVLRPPHAPKFVCNQSDKGPPKNPMCAGRQATKPNNEQDENNSSPATPAHSVNASSSQSAEIAVCPNHRTITAASHPGQLPKKQATGPAPRSETASPTATCLDRAKLSHTPKFVL